MEVFDLTEIQANYILDMPLRRLTKFSKLELDDEKAELETTIEELTAILDDEKLLRKVVGDELAEVAKQHGTPRRTVLLESAGAPVDVRRAARGQPTTRASCFLSSAGLLARTRQRRAARTRRGPRQARRDRRSRRRRPPAARSASSRRAGRLLKLDVLDLPVAARRRRTPRSSKAAPPSPSSSRSSRASGRSR